MHEALVARGFRHRGNTFRLRLDEVIQIANIQRSRASTRAQVRFFVNLGVASQRLLKRQEVDPQRCSIEDCHWRDRLLSDDLRSDGDSWVVESTTATRVAASVSEALLTHGLPRLQSLGSDAAIRDLWLSNKSPGLTRVQRLMNLCLLLKEIGPLTELPSARTELREVAERTGTSAAVLLLKEMEATW
jgi:hypothetical protein